MLDFKIGDILLKVDVKDRFGLDTRHHMMLVLGKDDVSGLPVVAHMCLYARGARANGLIVETLPHIRDLTLLSFDWPAPLRKKLQENVKQAVTSKIFYISEDRIKSQLQEFSRYRTVTSLEAECAKQRQTLHDAFISVQKPGPVQREDRIDMTCHEWVLDIIHRSCQGSDTAIPRCLQILPQHAWSDLILKFAFFYASKDRVRVTYIPRLSSGIDNNIISASPQGQAAVSVLTADAKSCSEPSPAPPAAAFFKCVQSRPPPPQKPSTLCMPCCIL